MNISHRLFMLGGLVLVVNVIGHLMFGYCNRFDRLTSCFMINWQQWSPFFIGLLLLGLACLIAGATLYTSGNEKSDTEENVNNNKRNWFDDSEENMNIKEKTQNTQTQQKDNFMDIFKIICIILGFIFVVSLFLAKIIPALERKQQKQMQEQMIEEAREHCLRRKKIGFYSQPGIKVSSCEGCSEFDEYFLNKYCVQRLSDDPIKRVMQRHHLDGAQNCNVFKHPMPDCLWNYRKDYRISGIPLEAD